MRGIMSHSESTHQCHAELGLRPYGNLIVAEQLFAVDMVFGGSLENRLVLNTDHG